MSFRLILLSYASDPTVAEVLSSPEKVTAKRVREGGYLVATN